MTDQRALLSRVPRSCIRNQSQENLLKRTKIVLALPSYNRQRLSGIRRGWCPSRSRRKLTQGIERVIRSDSGVAHRLSLSARVVSAVDSQVKAKRQRKKRLWRLQNRHAHRISTACPVTPPEPFPGRSNRHRAPDSMTGFLTRTVSLRLQLRCRKHESARSGTPPSSACLRAAGEDQPIAYYPGNIHPLRLLQAMLGARSRGGRKARPDRAPARGAARSPAQSSSSSSSSLSSSA